jgi:hypothetical protein
MKDESAFEFVLLERLGEECETFLLARECMTHERAREIGLACRLQYPTLFMNPLESFDGVLREAPPSLWDQFGRYCPQFESINRRVFLLELWPQLLWVVHFGLAELTWGGEFQRKFQSSRQALILSICCRVSGVETFLTISRTRYR